MTTGRSGGQDVRPLSVHSADRDGCCHLTLRGEFDLDAVHLVRAALDDAIARGRKQVLIDAAGVTFIDSSALVVLLAGRADLVASGGTLHLSDASPPVTRLLDIAMLRDLMLDSSRDEPRDRPPSVDRP
jgi:anti-sigma B factor antagonist